MCERMLLSRTQLSGWGTCYTLLISSPKPPHPLPISLVSAENQPISVTHCKILTRYQISHEKCSPWFTGLNVLKVRCSKSDFQDVWEPPRAMENAGRRRLHRRHIPQHCSHGEKKQKRCGFSYLLQAAGACAWEHHGVAAVVVCRHRGHAVILIYE